MFGDSIKVEQITKDAIQEAIAKLVGAEIANCVVQVEISTEENGCVVVVGCLCFAWLSNQWGRDGLILDQDWFCGEPLALLAVMVSLVVAAGAHTSFAVAWLCLCVCLVSERSLSASKAHTFKKCASTLNFSIGVGYAFS